MTGSTFTHITSEMHGIVLPSVSWLLILNKNYVNTKIYNESNFVFLCAGTVVGNWFLVI